VNRVIKLVNSHIICLILEKCNKKITCIVRMECAQFIQRDFISGSRWCCKGVRSSVVKCPPLNWKVGCSIHSHWVKCRSTPWASVLTQNRPGRGHISGFGLP